MSDKNKNEEEKYGDHAVVQNEIGQLWSILRSKHVTERKLRKFYF